MRNSWEDRREEIFDYLSELRDSGITNMFGAAPYIQSEYGLTSYEARNALMSWMKSF